ncbi:hypothetical protein K9L97_05670 [Candidatus Woesearchaeota archaeon]|nr:hypothetical protein [Candidatus Woesearchaeota archaeon]
MVEKKEVHKKKKSRVEKDVSIMGIILILIGAAYLLRDFIPWFSLWMIVPVILLVYGIYLLAKRKILTGIILIIIGLALIGKDIFYWFNLNYVWPVILILFGAYLILKKLK